MNPLDPALRAVLQFSFTRHVHGTTVARLPYTRSLLAGVFADLLMADACAEELVTARLSCEAMRDLSVILGARGYLREGDHAAFGQVRRALLATVPPQERPGDFERALLAAAGACLARWRQARRTGTPAFLADSAWLRAVLFRSAGRRSGRLRPLPDELTDALMTELTARWTEGAAFGLEQKET